jgi:hypothetical protein
MFQWVNKHGSLKASKWCKLYSQKIPGLNLDTDTLKALSLTFSVQNGGQQKISYV